MRYLVLGLVLVSLVGCAPQPADERPVVLETEDIGTETDTEFDISGDQRAAPRRSSSGQLPSDFPADLPIFQPSAISDIGEGGLGGFVQFLAQAGVERVGSWYRDALTRAGWTVELTGEGSMVASKGASRVRISLESSGPGTTISVSY